MKLSEYSNEQLGEMCRSRYQRLAQAHSDGLTDVHPLDTWREQSATLRSAKAQDSGGLGPVEIQNKKRGLDKRGRDGIVSSIEKAVGLKAPKSSGPKDMSEDENEGPAATRIKAGADETQEEEGAIEDEQQPSISGGLSNRRPAKDSALLAAVQNDFIRRSGHGDIEGQLNLAAARRVDPARVSAMGAAIKGYGRLRRR